MEITKLMNNGNITGVNTTPVKSNPVKNNETNERNVSTLNTALNTTNSSRVELKYADIKEQKEEVVENKSDRKTEGSDRAARLAEIKAQIQSGQFKVNSEVIADKMINNKDTMKTLLSE